MLIAFLSIQLWFCLKGEKKKRTMVAPDTGLEFELKLCIEWVFLCICIAYSFLPLLIRFHLKKFSNTLNKNFSFWGQIEVMQVFYGKFISLFKQMYGIGATYVERETWCMEWLVFAWIKSSNKNKLLWLAFSSPSTLSLQHILYSPNLFPSSLTKVCKP